MSVCVPCFLMVELARARVKDSLQDRHDLAEGGAGITNAPVLAEGGAGITNSQVAMGEQDMHNRNEIV